MGDKIRYNVSVTVSKLKEKCMRILVIIPAYNESGAIGKVVTDLTAASKTFRDPCDYVVINDGSSDRTEAVLKNMHLNAITLPANLGIGGAVQTGYIYADEFCYDIAIQMDGDGQHLPKYIPDLIAPIVRGEADFVVGSRFLGGSAFQSSSMRRFGIRFLSCVIRAITGKRIMDVTSGFRAVNARGIELFANDYAKDYPEPESIVRALKNGLRITEVPVEMAKRETGESSIGVLRSIYYMIKVTLTILLVGFERPSGKLKEATK